MKGCVFNQRLNHSQAQPSRASDGHSKILAYCAFGSPMKEKDQSKRCLNPLDNISFRDPTHKFFDAKPPKKTVELML